MIKTCAICEKEFHVKPSHFTRRFCCSKECQILNQKGRFVGDKNPNYRAAEKRIKICVICGNTFHPHRYEHKKYITCSKICGSKRKSLLHLGKIPTKETIKKANESKKILFDQRRSCPTHKSNCHCGRKKSPKALKCFECKKSNKNLICLYCKNKFIGKNSRQIYCSIYCLKEHYVNRYLADNNPNWKGGIRPINQRQRTHKAYLDWRKSVYIRDNYTCQDCGVKGGQLHAHHIKSFAKHPELRMDINNGKTLCVECHNKHHPSLSLSKLYSNDTRKWKKKKGQHYTLPIS